MKSPSLTALALVLVAAGLPGCAANEAASNSFDGSVPSDGGANGTDLGFFPGADLGNPFDAAFAATLSMTMRTPTPLASLLPTSQELDFDVVLNGATQMNVESWLDITPRGSVSPPITAGFLWTASPTGGAGAYSLHVIPTAPLDDLTDYGVRVIDQRVFRTALATGFSTGSRPRLSSATLNAQSAGNKVWIDLAFSEPMNASTVGPALTVSSGGASIAGTVTSSSGAAYRFDFAGGATGVTGAITLDLASSATAQSGTPLLLDDWDSPTSTGADAGTPFFEIVFPNVPLTTNVSTTWTPTVN
ncbi:MAG TPA: hypothetical protein VFF06_05600 [Polyangia bacterium]|nr:hypothetical protein [Polyangia bacterium]